MEPGGPGPLDLAESDPRAAVETLTAALRAPGTPGAERGLMQYALGVALRTLEDLDGSDQALHAAIETARDADEPALAGDATLSLAATRAMQGRIEEAFALLEDAEGAPEPAATHARTQRAGWTARMGDVAEATRLFEEAETRLEARQDLRWLAHLRNNRGLMRTYVGAFDDAERDLRSALHLYDKLSWDVSAAEAEHNLGFLLARRGDIVEALAHYRRAAETYSRLGLDPGELPTDEAEVLLLAGLTTSAAEIAASVIGELGQKDVQSELAEAYLMHARAAHAAGHTNAAARSADAAAELFGRQGRDVWAARAELLRDPGGSGHASRLARSATRLHDAGLVAAAIEAQLAAAEALEGEAAAAQHARAMEWLGSLDPAPLHLVVLAATVEATLAQQRSDPEGAVRPAQRALSAAERMSAGLPSPELRAHIGVRIERLAAMGRRAAISSGRTDRIFRWIEAGRANVLAPPPLTRSRDPATARTRAQLRALRAEAAAEADVAREIGRLERRAARMERARPGRVRFPPRVSLGAYKSALDGRRGLHLAIVDGTLHGLVIDSRARRMPPRDGAGFAAEAEDLTLHLMGALGTSDHIAASTAPVLDLPGRSASQTTVVCPPRRLFAAAWSAMRGLDGTPIAITPSARWFAAAPNPPVASRVAALVGPGLATGDGEIAAVQKAHGASVRTGSTVVDATRLLTSEPVVHIAAHATYRADNPLLSTIELEDGPLFVYDIGDLERVPGVLVIGACSAGASGGQGGLLGFVGTLLGLGTSSVIAPIIAVPDTDATVDLMAALHEQLASGLAPAEALARARMAVDHPVGHAFQCFGR